MSTNKILVTGATGTIGRQLVEELLKSQTDFAAAVRNRNESKGLAERGVKLVELDLTKPDTLEKGFAGFERLFLLLPFVENMVELNKASVDAATKAGVKHIVRLSATGANPNGKIIAGRWHGTMDKYLADSGLAYTILKPTFFMQNLVNYQGHSIRANNAFYMPIGDAKVSIIDTRDIAAVAARCLTESGHEGKSYELTGPQGISYGEMAQFLSQATGRTISYVDVPEDAARSGMQQAGMPAWMIDAMMELNGIAKAGYTAAVSPHVEKVLGRPASPFAQFAQDFKDRF